MITYMTLKIIFWNIHGFNSLVNIDHELIDEIIKNDIICLSETWLHNENFSVPIFLQNYSVFSSKAIKEKSKGRASGGLAIFVKKKFKF